MESRVCPQCGSKWYSADCTSVWVCERCGNEIQGGKIEGLDWTRERKMRKEMSEMNDIFQVDYLPDEKKIKINLPEEVWKNIDTIIMTKQFQKELTVFLREFSFPKFV